MIYGTLLGDGRLTAKRNSRYQAVQCWAQRDYLWQKYMILQGFVRGIPSERTKTKRGYRSVGFWTAAMPEFTSLRTLWYPGGKKRICPEILDHIDKMGFLPTVAWWFADDGSRSGRDDSPTMIFCTHGFQHPRSSFYATG